MKDLSKMLNIDINEIEPLEVSKIEKKQVKRYVLGNKKKKRNVFRNIAIAAFITIGATVTTSFAFPSLASQIPFMQNVMSYFNNVNSYSNNYNDFATEIDQVQTSNGVSMMIEDAVFDGTSLTVSYAIESDIDLGPSPRMSNPFFDISEGSGIGGTGSIEKINETTYVGFQRMTPHFNKTAPDELKVSWRPEAIIIDPYTNTEIKGDWQFDFKLLSLENKVELVNGSVTSDGVTVEINSFEKNDLSTVIHYEYMIKADVLKNWPFTSAQFDTVQDDLGNTYVVNGNTARSNDKGLSFKSSGTIKPIDPKAKTLTIVPTIYFSLGSGKGIETKDMEPIIIELQ